MSDPVLEQRLRAYFRARADAEAPPPFEAMLAGATATAQPRRWTPLVLAVAAFVMAIGVALLLRPASTPSAADVELIAQLTASTHWRAPSDALLADLEPEAFMGLPAFDDMTYRTEEVKSWI
jgi:hypothetical protein